MDKFNGFSQADINKLAGVAKHKKPNGPIMTAEALKQGLRGQHGGIRRLPENWSKSTENLRKPPQTKLQSKSKAAAAKEAIVADKEAALEESNLDRSMSKSIEEALFYQPLKKPANGHSNGETNGVLTASEDSDSSSILKLPTMDDNVTSTVNDSIEDSSILPTERNETAERTTAKVVTKDSPYKGISLKDFESHRKLIQEQNKQKKELLYKAIEQHSQKTAAETRKIEEIKSELAKLDNDLAVDVSILRKQIDNACINFANIEKQYMKIEAQFLKAKIDLHNAAEKKELLTEHLCTVITHNEDRKAQKLTELMQKVGLTENDEYEAPTMPNLAGQ